MATVNLRINFCHWVWLVACLPLLGIGCDSQPQSEAIGSTSGSDEMVAVEITDRLGRKLRLQTKPERVVSLSPATTELVFALDAGELLVGATEYCDYPAAAKQIPRVGAGPIGTISLEAIVGLKPDLVLCKFDSHQPLIETLDRMHIAVLAVGPESLEELWEEADWLGQLLNRSAQAQQLRQSMQQRLNEIVQRVPSNRRHKVFFEVWNNPLMSVGPGSFIDQLLRLAGLENIVDANLGRYPQISTEAVLRADPDLILLPATPNDEQQIEHVLQRPGWSEVAAIRHQRVSLIDGDLVSRCGPRMLDALEQIVTAAYYRDSSHAN